MTRPTPDLPPDPAVGEALLAALPSLPFHFSALEVEELADRLGLAEDRLLLELVPLARAQARPPLSGFQVGAAGRGQSGAFYLGVNLEFPGQPLAQTVHAEQAVVALAMAEGERGLSDLAVSAEPCGHCRQFLRELEGGPALRVRLPGHPPTPLAELLPRSFGPPELGLTSGLLAHPQVHLELPPGARSGPERALAEAARWAASQAWAPYSGAPSGVALRTSDGRLFRGSYLENAAFNPSLGPLQAALVCLVAAGLPYAEITEALLAEVEGAALSQAGATQALLEALAPEAGFSRILLGQGSPCPTPDHP